MSTMVATEAEATPKAEVTPEELLAMPDGGHYELIDGELRERNLSILSNVIASQINRILGNHCCAHNLGWILASELGYRCFPWKPGRIRRADVSFIRADRLSEERLSEGFCSVPPDLAIEVVSPNDLVEKLDEKVEEYLRAGVRLVWIVRASVRAVEVFRSDRSVSWLWAEDEISGEDVVPGFRCKVGSLFPRFSPAEADNHAKPVTSSETPDS
ncbi:MAG: Uma2 family endonuclease [Isosphaerales bacterium]